MNCVKVFWKCPFIKSLIKFALEVAQGHFLRLGLKNSNLCEMMARKRLLETLCELAVH